MENASTVRFSSCRGVAFEIKPHANPFAIDTTDQTRNANALREETSTRFRLPWDFMRNASKVFPSSMQHSMSRASSHFCDLDSDNDEEEEEGDSLYYLEEGGIKEGDEHHSETDEKAILDSSASKHSEKPPQPPVPKKRASRLSIILLDQGFFTVYKRLFVVSLFLNVVALVLAATGHFSYAKNRASLFSIANILALTLCRSEAFLRLVFYLTVKILGHSFVPLRIKIAVTSLLQSLGGIHSGCGVSSIAWLIYALVLTLKDRDSTSTAIIAVASAILSLLCLTSLAAFPLVRHLHHNVFERVHRFAGWSALGLVWAFIVLTISYDPISRTYDNLGSKLIKRQEFWFTLAITVAILLPWLTVRRVPVDVSSLSGHASLIKFRGGVKSGILGRISPSPLSEWHAFGIISDGKTSHMMLAGAVGDFTKSLVSKPPSHLWVRTVHFAGLPYLVNLYDKVLVVATGSGICVFLSFLMQQSKAEVYLIWVAKGLDDNFGSEIVNRIKDYPHQDRIIVHDTAILGRPNVSEMSVKASKKFGAQVVIVTSNPEGSRDVVNACKASGVPAFGPIWDS